ncbi:hypothetical protein [Hyphomicrobium sp.]|uniref:hypothetical protein n=1 Tax=Hyphomicrobium sp. TaxID=82 RepID=UPI001D7D8DF0|nr:hypothetical protein [Hyphomicrobium sp.]MBY0559833.1 hypothetical protein [Hyphomicrobium sp.]
MAKKFKGSIEDDVKSRMRAYAAMHNGVVKAQKALDAVIKSDAIATNGTVKLDAMKLGAARLDTARNKLAMAKFTGERKYAEEGLHDLALAKKHFAKIAKEAAEIAASQSMDAVQKLYLETHGNPQAGVRGHPYSDGLPKVTPLKSAWSRTEHESGHISIVTRKKFWR